MGQRIKTIRYLSSGILPVLLVIPICILLSEVYPFSGKGSCVRRDVMPHCQNGILEMIGNEDFGGRVIDLQRLIRDDCVQDLEIQYYYLDDGREIISPVKFSFGSHWLKSFMKDERGRITECDFELLVTHPSIEWPVRDDPELPSEYIGKLPMIDMPNDEFRFNLGSLSLIWESGQQGPGVISSGRGDPGGPSYGLYQISLKQGYLEDFLLNEGQVFNSVLGQYEPGSEEFNMAWKAIADIHPVQFQKAQHEYIRRSHYLMLARRVKRQFGFDINQYSEVLKDVLWSTAVQHGPFNNVVYNALKNEPWKDMSETEIVNKIYRERSRMVNGYLSYFPRVGPRWKKNLAKRFEKEEQMALGRLNKLEATTAYLESVPEEEMNLPKADLDSITVQKSEHPEVALVAQFNSEQKVLSFNSIKEGKENNTIGKRQPTKAPSKKIASDSIEKEFPKEDLLLEVPRTELKENVPTRKKEVDAEGPLYENRILYSVLFVVLSDQDVAFPHLNNLGEIIQDPISERQIRYLIGKTPSLEEARLLKKQVQKKGFRVAQIARYKDNRLKGFVD